MRKQYFKAKQAMRSGIAMAAICLALGASLAGCGKTGTENTGDGNKQAETTKTNTPKETVESNAITGLVGTPSDYAEKDNWMAIPEITHEVDTFYLYPTCYMDDSEGAKPICDIDNEAVRTQAQSIYENQATVFEESTNVFAPYYRQSNIYHITGMNNKEVDDFQKNEQRTDVYAALDYYFEHYNNGRPFIIAGHSQGSIMARMILGEYMEAHPEYYERMVAAYVIGYSITTDWLKEHPYLKFAEGADDTGVIVSWNTEGPGNKELHNFVVEDGAISINPINWKRDDTYASAEENLGSRILNKDTGSFEIKKKFADAQLNTERGVVVCTTDKVEYTPMTQLFGTESLHNNDYALYYENLRENIKTRIENF